MLSRYPHGTADEVAEIRATSRRAACGTLAVLVGRGPQRRIQPAGSAARNEHRVGDIHHHLVCRTCGRIVDVECAVSHPPSLEVDDDRGFVIDEAEFIYWAHRPERRPEPKARAKRGCTPDS